MSEYVVDVPDGMSITHASDGTYPTCCRELTMCAEVVRCRDCEHWGGLWDWDEAIGCDLVDLPQADPNGFCAWGERRGDAQV
ncbi:hypothetical protein [Olsenella uli]|uniref:hypothetical protein n=1 Tax=Olsenella uli TaxID=133926 RepID=UPI00241FDF72|nr:hypothetical protein [Olsenella uli]